MKRKQPLIRGSLALLLPVLCNRSIKPLARSDLGSFVVGYIMTWLALLPCFTTFLVLAGCGGKSATQATAPPPPQQPSLSSSKLGPHVLGDPNNAGAMTILGACPRVAKWVLPYAGTDLAISYYKGHCPGGTVVLRVYVSPSMATYSPANDPVASADDFWNHMMAQGLSSAGQPNQIDWLEGPNELDNLPNWYNDPNTATWLASFWSTLADLMHNAGYNPLVGSVLAGQPSPVTIFAPVVGAMKSKQYKWGWSYHSYTFGATMDVGAESAYALYYRQVRDQNGLAGIPLVLTEGGYVTPSSTGWQGHLTNAQYLSWLKWFDAQLKQDPEVLGLTIFQVGNTTDWQSFDLTPIAPDLANYLTTGS